MMRVLLFISLSILCFDLQSQNNKDLTFKVDSTLTNKFKTGKIIEIDKTSFETLISKRPKELINRIDSVFYEYLIIDEEFDVKTKKYTVNETYVAKGFNALVCYDNSCRLPHEDYRGVFDSDSKLIFNFPYKIIEPFYPEPIYFGYGCTEPSKQLLKKVKKASAKEKKKGATMPTKYAIITVINRNKKTISLSFFIPKAKVKEVKLSYLGGP